MANLLSKTLCMAAVGALASGLVLATASTVSAQDVVTHQERYVPTIWIDPDGCEHWVMDDGAEGYMDNHLTRDGKPVCHNFNLCGEIDSDQLFSSGSYRISAAGRAKLASFFESAPSRGYIINGHTDSRASDAYNMRLSYNRAKAVADIATSVGAKVVDVRGYGERMPKVPNTSVGNMAKNRRVEIVCVK